ncbi:MAG: hypothetical protein K2Q01_06130, partial [Rickettsiales bacterium]|nr:hypothetical protein [Rickettsiales bacterium]
MSTEDTLGNLHKEVAQGIRGVAAASFQTMQFQDMVLSWKALVHEARQQGEGVLAREVAALRQVNREANFHPRESAQRSDAMFRAIDTMLQLPLMNEAQVYAAFSQAYYARDIDTLRILSTGKDENPLCDVDKLKEKLRGEASYQGLERLRRDPAYREAVDGPREDAAYAGIQKATGLDMRARSASNMQDLRDRVGALSEHEKAYLAFVVDAFAKGNFHMAQASRGTARRIGGKMRDAVDDRAAIEAADALFSSDARKAMGGDTSFTSTSSTDVQYGNMGFVFFGLQLGQPKHHYPHVLTVSPGALPKGSMFNLKDWQSTHPNMKGVADADFVAEY